MTVSTRRSTANSKQAPPPQAPRPAIEKKRTPRTSSARASSTKTAPSKNLPDLTVLCDDGHTRPLFSFFTTDAPGMVLFTYPRANTGGCTAQASGLSAFADEAGTLGYSVVGASYDSIKSQASWKAKLSLKCRLLCDTLDTGLLKHIGAHKAPKSVKRSVFIVRKDASRDDPVIVESRIVISPKDSISFVQKYVRDHPCTSTDDEYVQGKNDDAAQTDGEQDAGADDGSGEKAGSDVEKKADDIPEVAITSE